MSADAFQSAGPGRTPLRRLRLSWGRGSWRTMFHGCPMRLCRARITRASGWLPPPTAAHSVALRPAHGIFAENAATPRKPKGPSPEHSMQKPTVRLGALTEYPQLYTVDIKHRVVIAADITSVPPTCLDSLHITQKKQRAA